MTPPDPVAAHISDVLDAHDGGLTVRDLTAAVKGSGARISRAAIERTLSDDPRFTDDGGGLRARWTVQEITVPEARPVVDRSAPLDGLDLRDWQVEAFAAWAAGSCRGVVEAVTGSGKTRLAIAAVRACLAREGRALVLAPTLDLVEQWCRELRVFVPRARVGRLGGGQADDLHAHDVVVATPHSAADVPVDLPPGTVGLLVADEAHRYGAPTWGGALREGFAMRLALTATYERNDDGIADVLGPYFGGIVHAYSFANAAADGVIAPFDVRFAGVALDPSEREIYAAQDRRAKELYRALVGDHRMPRDPRRTIQAAAEVIAAHDRGERVDRRTLDASRGWLSAVRARRDVAAQAAGKLAVVRAVAPGLVGRRTLVFTDTVRQAENAARVLAATGIAAEEVHGDLPGDKRRIRLAQFAKGNLDAVAAPRVLDEGVDVPDADVAVVLASFRTRRQTIQRLGRVLRTKADGRAAKLVIAFAADTREDPADGAHAEFIEEILDVARSVETLDVDTAPGALADFVRC